MLLAAALILAQAATLPFPQWDVDAACGKMPAYAAKPCVEEEQSSYEALKEEWPLLTDAQRTRAKASGDQAQNYRYTVAHHLASSFIAIEEARKPVQVPRFKR